jgi:2-polyprenyl-3-methyl-5-hydroxy-6-metoxy-1,4-benzoquinol methylase
MSGTAKEPQNQIQFENYRVNAASLGPYTTHIWRTDPRHLLFLLARYKFVAKMLEGKKRVLEVGCGDGFGVPVVAQTVDFIHGLDFEPMLLEDNRKRLQAYQCSFECLDITASRPNGTFDAAYSLDVIEHVPEAREHLYFANIAAALDDNGILIVGTPNETANEYASEGSRRGHINLKSHAELRGLLGRFFVNVFMFSMNDEMVHTGFGPMAHYLLAMGVGVRRAG